MSTVLRVAIVLTLATVVVQAQDNPLLGSWKLNPGKSDMSGAKVVIKQVGPEEMELFAEGRSYRFKLNGQEVPALFGYTAAWTKTGENSWKSVVTLKGKDISTDTYELTPDGKTLTVT